MRDEPRPAPIVIAAIVLAAMTMLVSARVPALAPTPSPAQARPSVQPPARSAAQAPAPTSRRSSQSRSSETSPAQASAQSAKQAPTQAQLLQEGLSLLETRGDPRAAAVIFERATVGPDRKVGARARLYVGVAYEKSGQQQARQQYERVLRDFADQPDVVAEARARLAVIARSSPTNRPVPPTVTMRHLWARDPSGLTWYGSVARDGRTLTFGNSNGTISVAEITSPDTAKVAVDSDGAGAANHPGPDVAVPSPEGTGFITQWLNKSGGTDLRVTRGIGAASTIFSIPDGYAFSGVEWPARDLVLTQVSLPDRRATLHIINVADGSNRQVAALDTASTRVALSGDGRWVVYDVPVTVESPARNLFILDTRSGATAPLVDDPGDDRLPAWTARGDYLLFVSDRTGSTCLWGLPMLGGKPDGPPKMLQPELGRITMVLGLTNDDAYHYLRQVGLVDVYAVTIGADGRPDGQPRGAARSFVGSNMGPSFSPDGRTLAFLAQMAFATRESLGLRDVALGTQRTVTTGMTFMRLPGWAPDGSRILVKGNDATGRYGFHLVDPRDGATVPLVTVPPDRESSLGMARWSPDGDRILYTQAVRGRTEMRRHDVKTGLVEVVFASDEGARIGQFDVSRANGTMAMLVNQQNETRIVVRDTAGISRVVGTFTGAERPGWLTWAADGRSLWFVRPTGIRNNAGIWRVGIDGGNPEAIGVEMPGLRALAVSPDGTQLAFTAGTPDREPWVVEHFLPATPAAATRRPKP